MKCGIAQAARDREPSRLRAGLKSDRSNHTSAGKQLTIQYCHEHIDSAPADRAADHPTGAATRRIVVLSASKRTLSMFLCVCLPGCLSVCVPYWRATEGNLRLATDITVLRAVISNEKHTDTHNHIHRQTHTTHNTQYSHKTHTTHTSGALRAAALRLAAAAVAAAR